MSRECRLRQCLGLGSSASPRSLVCDPESGRYALVEAVNLDVHQGRLVRRPGRVRLDSVGYDSLFAHGDVRFGVRGAGLYAIAAQGGERLLRGDLTVGAPMAWVGVGETVYFANGRETGCVRDGTALPWGGGRYPGPDRTGRFVSPPPGQALAWHAGRIWIADGRLVRFTEGAGLVDWVDAAFGFLAPFTGCVRLLTPVGDGLFIGDDTGVHFAAGQDPKTMRLVRASPVPPLAGSAVALEPGRHAVVAGREIAGGGVVFACRDGLYLGVPGGGVSRLHAGVIPSGARLTAVATRDRYLLFASDAALPR